MQNALLDVGDVCRTDGHLRTGIGELLQPKRDVPHHVFVRAFLFFGLRHDALLHLLCLPNAVEVVLALRAVDGYADGEVVQVLLDEALHLLAVVVDAVGGEREAVGVEPMMIAAEHLLLQVIANLVYEVNLEERLAPDEVPHHALLLEVILMVEDIVNGLLCYLPGHPLLRVLPHEVAILASQLAVLRNDEGDGLGHAVLPRLCILFNSIHMECFPV